MPRSTRAAAITLLCAWPIALQAQTTTLDGTPAQTQQHEQNQAPRGPRVTRKAVDNPFATAMTPWFSLAPQGSNLIRAPNQQGGVDLSAREDHDTYVTVYAKKKTVDLHEDRQHDYSAPGWSDVQLPKEIPIGPPGSCSSGAYRTIGGQPATGADLVGGLGGGRC